MGAKTPHNAEKHPIKCENCQLTFQKVTALKSHIRAKHPSDEVKKNEESENKDDKKTAFVPPTSRVSKRLQLRKKSGDAENMLDKKAKAAIAGRKAQFECPKCLKLFPVYFSALKHLEKRHPVDLDNENSSDTDMKPILVETCTSCEKRIVDVQHTCGTKEDSKLDKSIYSCLGCEKNFGCVDSFDQHIAVAHNKNVDVMMFKEFSDFLLWKSAMESLVHAKYLMLSNTSNKQYYQCNYVSPKNSADTTHLCPSIIILRKMRKGIQIHYYKSHHSHTCPEYKVPKSYVDNIVDSMANNDFDSLLTENKSIEENELYEKFIELMNNIIVHSEKLNLTKLKKLYSIAADMEDIISELQNSDDNSNNDDNDDELIENEKITKTEISLNKSMTDDQISKVLEPRTSERIKRRSDSSTPNIIKRKKIDKNNTSLKENNSITKNAGSPLLSKTSPIVLARSPSFNDSYKEFIGTTTSKLPRVQNNNITTKKRKDVVKTKIGQFIPSPEKQKNMEILSKKKRKISKSPINSLSLDMVDYEVVEQENDCNILVLKI